MKQIVGVSIGIILFAVAVMTLFSATQDKVPVQVIATPTVFAPGIGDCINAVQPDNDYHVLVIGPNGERTYVSGTVEAGIDTTISLPTGVSYVGFAFGKNVKMSFPYDSEQRPYYTQCGNLMPWVTVNATVIGNLVINQK